jgi:DNA topoisomerase-3
MRLVVAEKPSVARDIARVIGASTKGNACIEGNGVRVTWCIGHLAELEDPAHYNPAWKRWSFDTLPMLPEKFELRLREGDVRDHFAALEKMLRDRSVKEVVNACDAGREGELIFRYVYELAGCRKPVLRLWTSSLTDQAIRSAWSTLRPAAEYDALADAARSRSEADWLVGLNATRALTCLARGAGGDQLLSVGRVQTPTLAMIVARDRAIECFVPEPYWLIRARLSAADKGEWEATFFRAATEREQKGEQDEAPPAERVPTREMAEAIVAATLGRPGVVVDAERKRVREQPPLLYDLTSLQRRANERYGLSAPQTLQIAQALYEKHKLITYPRTDARYITPDQVGELPGILEGLAGLEPYRPFAAALLAAPLRPGKRVVDAAEVGDHHAILPTGRTPEAARLTPDERRVFDLVARRLMAALSPDALFDATTLVTRVEPGAPLPDGVSTLLYRARGRVCREQGWRAVDPPGRSRELELPNVEVGDDVTAADVRVVEEKTRPPRSYTDSTLLGAMETAGRSLDDDALKRAMRHAGLGTPATRAAILEMLLGRQYVSRDGRDLRATDRGRALVDAVPIDELKSAELTGRWEARLAAIAEGREERARFMSDVAEHVRNVVTTIAAAAPPPAEVRERAPTPVLGACPVCGTPVRENPAVFTCETGRACSFVVFKTMSKRAVSTRMVKQLLKEGRTDILKGWKSKAGKDFEAGLEWRDGKVQFHFPPRDDATRGSGDEREPRKRRRGGEEGSNETAPDLRRDRVPAASHRPGEGAAHEAVRGDTIGSTEAASVGGPVGMSCPTCHIGVLVRGRSAWGCDRWREGCRFVLPFAEGGRPLSDAEARARVVQARAGA